GDVSTVPYKQIVIASGVGPKQPCPRMNTTETTFKLIQSHIFLLMQSAEINENIMIHDKLIPTLTFTITFICFCKILKKDVCIGYA
ncbi:MAG: hypothetical protein P8104_10165, partial [Gammaproteobacteria bacterium]